MNLDFIEKMSESTMADCILKVALKKYFTENDFDSFDLFPSEIVCDQTTFMSLTPELKDVAVTIGDRQVRLWDFIETHWGDYSYCTMYPSNELKKFRLMATFSK